MNTCTMKIRGRKVTQAEALKSAHRLINSHFHNEDRARCSIPVRSDDDDVTVIDYIHEQSEDQSPATRVIDSDLRDEIKRLASSIESVRDGVVSHIFAMQSTEAALRSLIIKIQELDIKEVSDGE